MTVYLESSWAASLMRKCSTEKGLLKKREKPATFNLRLVELFSQMSLEPNPLARKIAVKPKELTQLFATLKKGGVFSNAQYTSKNGFYLLNSLEEVCKKKNGVVALALIKVGAPITFSAIKAAVNSELWDVLESMYPKIISILAKNDLSAQKMLPVIFKLKNQKTFLDLIDAGLPLDISLDGETLVHIASKRGFTALAQRVVNEKMDTKFTFSSLGEESQSPEDWLDVFHILHRNRKVDLENLREDVFYDLIKRLHGGDRNEKRRAQGEKVLLQLMQEVMENVSDDKKMQLIGSSLIVRAAFYDFQEIGRFLCETGVDLAATDEDGDNVLLIAVDRHLELLLQVIWKSLAKMPQDNRREILEQVGGDELTPLLLALKNGDENTARKLMEFKADQSAMDKEGWGCVHYALSSGLIALLEEKRKEGQWIVTPDILKRLEKSENENVGMICCRGRQWESVLWFLRNGGEFEMANAEQETLLHLAAHYGSPVVVQEILKSPRKDVLMAKKNDAEYTPLEEALLEGWEEIYRLLIGNGSQKEREGLSFDDRLDGIRYQKLKRWQFLWSVISEKDREALRKQGFLAASARTGEWDLVEFFFKEEFSVAAPNCDSFQKDTVLDAIGLDAIGDQNLPPHLKTPILQKFFEEIQNDEERLKSKESFGALFDEKIGDLTLQGSAGNQVFSFRVGASILAARSSYFQKQFFGPMKKGAELLVLSEDLSLSEERSKSYCSAFEKLLRYFYSRTIEVTCDDFKILAELADRWTLGDVKNILEEWLKWHPAFASWGKFLHPDVTKMSIEEACQKGVDEHQVKRHKKENKET